MLDKAQQRYMKRMNRRKGTSKFFSDLGLFITSSVYRFTNPPIKPKYKKERKSYRGQVIIG